MKKDTFSIITFGCKVNQYDSQVIREQFCKLGYTEVGFEKSNICIVNTCTVTNKADREARSAIYKLRRRNPRVNIVVTGCYANDYSKQIHKATHSLITVRSKDKFKLPEILKLSKNKSRFKFIDNKIEAFSSHSRAFVKIQDGCNNRCSYCKVPLVRGRSISKDPNLLKEEIRGLIRLGFKEIVLSGVCLGSYGKDLIKKFSLSDLLCELLAIDGNFRIRLSSIEAIDVTDKLISLVEKNRKICRHFHIPFQSGDDIVLKNMQRRYKVMDYLRLISKIRSRIPGVGLTTDIIVGFPGEEEKNFNNTLTFLKKIHPMRMHLFTFSPRAGTAAYSLTNKKNNSLLLSKRKHTLSELAKDLSFEFRNTFLNRNLEVLCESKSEYDSIKGYTDNYIMTSIVNGTQDIVDSIIATKIVEVKRDITKGVFSLN